MQVTATEAKNRFGSICTQAKKAPVFVHKDGVPDSVILSFSEFESMRTLKMPAKTLAQRQSEFNETYKDWIAEQNAHFEKHGLWCDGLVAWMGDE